MCPRASRARSSSVAPRSSSSSRRRSTGPSAAWRAPCSCAGESGRREDAAAARARAAAPPIAGRACCAASARPSAPASWPTRRSPRRCGGSSASSTRPRSRSCVGPARDELARLRARVGRDRAGGAERPTAAGDAFAQARLFGLLRGSARPAGRRRARRCSRSRTCTGPTARRSSSSPRCCAACATSACCSSAPIAATSCTAAIRCARSWPRRSAARWCSGSSSSPSRRAELAAQVAGILGGAADPELVARLHARCEGNAFFAEELLAASGGAAGPLPPSLREVLGLRLEALPHGRARGAARGRGSRAAVRPSAARRRHRPARARAPRCAARGGDPPRARPRQRRLRLPPRPARGGRLRRPAPR